MPYESNDYVLRSASTDICLSYEQNQDIALFILDWEKKYYDANTKIGEEEVKNDIMMLLS